MVPGQKGRKKVIETVSTNEEGHDARLTGLPGMDLLNKNVRSIWMV